MADAIPSSNPKKETVRITLPPRTNEPTAVKRETVRIAQNASADKGQTIRIQPPSAPLESQPKKETTKILAGSAPTFTPPTPKPKSAPIPVPPAPSVPKAAPVPPTPPAPPVPPKPPGAFSVPAAKPSISLSAPPAPAAPAPAAAAPKAPAATAAPAAPQKPIAPKKETSRIPIPPPSAAGAAMPKATVKLQQTQPLPQAPAASVVKTTSLTTAASAPAMANAADPLVLWASVAVFVASLAAAVLSYLTYSASA